MVLEQQVFKTWASFWPSSPFFLAFIAGFFIFTFSFFALFCTVFWRQNRVFHVFFYQPSLLLVFILFYFFCFAIYLNSQDIRFFCGKCRRLQRWLLQHNRRRLFDLNNSGNCKTFKLRIGWMEKITLNGLNLFTLC